MKVVVCLSDDKDNDKWLRITKLDLRKLKPMPKWTKLKKGANMVEGRNSY